MGLFVEHAFVQVTGGSIKGGVGGEKTLLFYLLQSLYRTIVGIVVTNNSLKPVYLKKLITPEILDIKF